MPIEYKKKLLKEMPPPPPRPPVLDWLVNNPTSEKLERPIGDFNVFKHYIFLNKNL